MRHPGSMDFLEGVIAQGPAEIDAVQHRADGGGERFDLNVTVDASCVHFGSP